MKKARFTAGFSFYTPEIGLNTWTGIAEPSPSNQAIETTGAFSLIF
jgi:hypothetical protein